MHNWVKYVQLAKYIASAVTGALVGAGVVPDEWAGFLNAIFGS